eukprot:1862093-Rhodomonas_salina.1
MSWVACASGFVQDANVAANNLGVDVVVSVEFELGDRSEIENAVSQIARSGARITLCIAFDNDMATIAAVADEYGMVDSGFAWIVFQEQLTAEVLASSPDPESTVRQLSGWFAASLNLLHGEQGIRFQNVFQNEPLHHLDESVVNESTFAASIAGAPCNQFCATMYDSVWAAAIALGRVG